MLQQEGETPQVHQGELSGQLDSCGEHVGPEGFSDESRLTLMDHLYSLKMARDILHGGIKYTSLYHVAYCHYCMTLYHTPNHTRIRVDKVYTKGEFLEILLFTA